MTAAVVDPQRDIGIYLSFATEHKLQIKHVFLTHLHADFVAGHLELRDQIGAAIYLGAKAQAEYKFTPLSDGNAVEFGRVRMKAIETPGHTPESISIAVYDLAKNETEPHAVLTSDTRTGGIRLCASGRKHKHRAKRTIRDVGGNNFEP